MQQYQSRPSEFKTSSYQCIVLLNRNQFEMKFFHKLKAVIRKTDMFYATDMLRYEKEGEYSTLTGGLLSVGIIIAILVGFASMILDTLNLSVISTQLSLTKQIDPTPITMTANPESNFMFGIELWRLNLSDTKRFFDVKLYLQHESGGKIDNITLIQLEACTPNHWTIYPELIKNFDKLEAGGWLCPSLDLSLELRGKYTSSSYSSLIFAIDPCSNSTFPQNSCASSQQIDQKFIDNEYFYFTFYFINPVINSDQKDYKSYYLQEKSFVIFGKQLGAEAFLYFADYQITTDNSIWPYTNTEDDIGIIAQDSLTIRTFPRFSGTYVNFYINKSPNSITYVREVQKISSVFSFIGGMISAISATLFIVKIYNSLSFELSIALQIFKPQESSGLQKKSLKMNIFNFFKYYFYIFTKMVGKPLQSKSLRFINQCQQQILSQLDIKQLIKRIIFLQHCLNFIFEDYQLQGLQVKKPTSPHQIRKIRLKCQSIERQLEDEVFQSNEESSSSLKSQINMKIMNNYQQNIDSQSQRAKDKPHRLVSFKKKGKNQEIQIIDINSDNLSAFNEINPAIRSKIKLQLKKQQNLDNLKKDAAFGNPTSRKIWNFVQQDGKF